MDIYREEILEHWKNPLNYGRLAEADLVVEQVNPLCGDEVAFYFKIKNKKIIEVSFEGKGCAISIAAASMFSEAIEGRFVDEVLKTTGEDVFKLLGGPVAPARLKCAFMPLEAVRKLRAEN